MTWCLPSLYIKTTSSPGLSLSLQPCLIIPGLYLTGYLHRAWSCPVDLPHHHDPWLMRTLPCQSGYCPWVPPSILLGAPGPPHSPNSEIIVTSEKQILCQTWNGPHMESLKKPFQRGLDSDSASANCCHGLHRMEKKLYHNSDICMRTELALHRSVMPFFVLWIL